MSTSIGNTLKEAVNRVEAQRNAELETERQRVMREKIAPFNNDIDASCRQAIEEERGKLAHRIAELQKSFDEEVAMLQRQAQAKKEEYAQVELSTATSVVNARYETTISKMKKIIEEVGE